MGRENIRDMEALIDLLPRGFKVLHLVPLSLAGI